MNPILSTLDLTHVYSVGTPFEHTAIRKLNMEVFPGECLGLIGHTGSGKSTLIQHLNGLLLPSSGKVLLHGKDINESAAVRKEARSHVGLVFQYPEYQLFEETVFQDIAYGPGNMGLSREETERRVRHAASLVGLGSDMLSMSPFDLSGGLKRRAAIAGVLAMEPEVLVLDEPTAGLDPAGSADIMKNLDAYRRESGCAMVIVSHDMGQIARYADRILVLNHGEAFLQGDPGQVFAHARELAEIGLDIPEITRLFLRLKELGLPVDPSVYTVEQAAAALLALKDSPGGGKNPASAGSPFGKEGDPC